MCTNFDRSVLKVLNLFSENKDMTIGEADKYFGGETCLVLEGKSLGEFILDIAHGGLLKSENDEEPAWTRKYRLTPEGISEREYFNNKVEKSDGPVNNPVPKNQDVSQPI